MRSILSIIFCLIILASCNKDKTPIPVDTSCDPDKVYFSSDILPILSSNCAKSGCHDAITQEEGFDFTTYSSAVAAANDDLIEVITETDPDDIMPPPGNTPLTIDQIQLINKWISQGANNEFCENSEANCSTDNVTYSNDIVSIIGSNCLGCHSGSSPTGGINLSNYSGVSAVASTGKLYNAVLQNGSAVSMPPSGKLSNCNILKIKVWIDAGFPNN